MRKRTFDPDAILAAIARGERSCGDLEMRIGRDGTWFYRGLRQSDGCRWSSCSRAYSRAPDGSYWLVTPVEQARVEVEDAPFVAVELRRTVRGERSSGAAHQPRGVGAQDRPTRSTRGRRRMGRWCRTCGSVTNLKRE